MQLLFHCIFCCLGHAQLSSLPNLSYGSIYMKLWHGLTTLDLDPHPSVRHMSYTVTNYIRDQVRFYMKISVFDTFICPYTYLPLSQLYFKLFFL
jgi:hypothetical protein